MYNPNNGESYGKEHEHEMEYRDNGFPKIGSP